MLVLSRKIGTRIVVDGPAVIEIVEIRGDKVRLGVTAPESTTIHREEVAARIAQAGEERKRVA